MRSRTIDRVHNTAALKQRIEVQATQQFVRAFFDDLRKQIPDKEQEKGREERRHELIEQRKTVLNTVRKCRSDWLGCSGRGLCQRWSV